MSPRSSIPNRARCFRSRSGITALKSCRPTRSTTPHAYRAASADAKEKLMSEVSGRRSFLTALASVTSLAAFGSRDAAAAQTASPSAGPFDMAWLEQMKGKHKQLYDLGSFDLGADNRPLRFCK